MQQQADIEQWFIQHWQTILPPLYTSVDLRDSGFKLAPVDTNLFPAGFNNLAELDHIQAAFAARRTILHRTPECRRVLLIPENHTRNSFYLENLGSLQSLLQKAGFEVRLGVLTEGSQHSLFDKSLYLEPVQRRSHFLFIEKGNFLPDVIILNNDLADGIPSELENIFQPILPSVALGWHSRLKSQHFGQYAAVCQEFATQFEWDPWIFTPLFRRCHTVDFMSHQGEECLVEHTQSLLLAISAQYQAYGIQKTPYVVIKADSGSYGMGVLAVETAESILQLSRKKRSHMTRTKGNRAIQKVILQEGIPTELCWQQAPAEPVLYLFGSEIIGGFYRTHNTRNSRENLNTPGMQLHPLAWSEINLFAPKTPAQDKVACQFYAYSVVARLAALAAAREETTVVGID